jgi:hypothetical protein
MRALYQGEATITRADRSHVAADVTIWSDDSDMRSGWGGRAVVRLPDSLADDLGSTCGIRWPVSGDGYMVGHVVLSGGQVGVGRETYRLAGSGDLARFPAEP